MSYGLAVGDGDRPLDDDQAGSAYDELYERYLESDDVLVPPAPRIRASGAVPPSNSPSPWIG
ncbi:hypothetical protein [Streptomyces sp. NPDC002599]|uniref:hypothetical protein n=1 Tax=Streptomyces sp. NPDC002599 TaxID=3154421 RepID=UPI003323B5F7